MSSQWTVRGGAEWTEGEDRFFTHLLDGSRAANRLGWQWTIGPAPASPTASPAAGAQAAPQLWPAVRAAHRCPIEDWPDDPRQPPRPTPSRCCAPTRPGRDGRPREVVDTGAPDAVWLTAESLGDADPALDATPTCRRLRVRRAAARRLACRASGWCSSPRPRRPRHAPRRRAAPRPGARGAGRAAPSPSRTRRCRASGRAPRRRAGARAPVPWLWRPHAGPDRLLHRLAQAAARPASGRSRQPSSTR
jgi:deoxyribodipyrimidine photo-lyase